MIFSALLEEGLFCGKFYHRDLKSRLQKTFRMLVHFLRIPVPGGQDKYKYANIGA